MKMAMRLFFSILLFVLISPVFSSCMSGLERDVKVRFKQYSPNMTSQIAEAQKRVKAEPSRIKLQAVRNRFLSIAAEDHGRQICAVVSYYLLLKYSDANVPDFPDFYLRAIDEGIIIETKSKEFPPGFALLAGPDAAARLVERYRVKGRSVNLLRSEERDRFDALLSSRTRYAVFGRVDEKYDGHYFLVYIDDEGVLRYADALNTHKFGMVVKERPRTVAILDVKEPSPEGEGP